MARSNIGGIYGFLRGSVGSGTYTTSTASIDGRRKQVVRQKVTNVNNPNTLAQIAQRMKMKPAQLFYDAFQKAAGSVENNPLSHSFEGVQYGNKSRLRFIQLAISGEPKAYVPKGIDFVTPGVYQVSEGSLPSLPNYVGAELGELIAEVGDRIGETALNNLLALGAQTGDQLTCVALVEETSGRYKAEVARVIVGLGNVWEMLNGASQISGVSVNTGGLDFTGGTNVACAAFILSRGTSTSSAKRSTAFMTIAPGYESLMAPEAYDAAVASYMQGISYNSLNSDWYLNQGNSQAFNGEVFLQVLNLPVGEGVAAVNAEFVLGRQSNGGSVVYTVFTTDGTSAGTAYAFAANQISTDVAFTAARVAAALGNVNIRYQQYTDAIGAQAQGNV